jgi:hypothetical protein
MPISETEERLCHEEGLDALEERFEAAGIDFLDPQRESVA